MRRFHSPLLKVHALFEQQSRLAEIELARAMSLQHEASRNVLNAEAELESAREMAAQTMKLPLQTAFLHGVQNHVGAAADRVEQSRQQLVEREAATQLVREAFQTVKSKLESVAQMLEKQRAEHRIESLKSEQSAMDDGAVFRWIGPESSDSKSRIEFA
ncbi:flagellar export protein FliJ [Planctomicrobium sp. SH527]|uniref:flagellar export protein FliJ n=1 Tax=Planctomicrobium sp. SH527 TaxID=3448123 RepID=UPI003F5BDF58